MNLKLFNYLSQEDKHFKRKIKNIIGVMPGNIFLYQTAFIHSSVAVEIKKGYKNSNERLEFLGDAFLNCVIAEILYKKFPYRDEGFLTNLRSKIVSRDNLNKIALKLGFDELLKFDKSFCRNVDYFNPTVFGNAFEAFLGALFLDKGYEKAKKIFYQRIYKLYIDIDIIENTETNYKSRLLEFAHKEHLSIDFKVIKEEIIKGKKFFTIDVILDGKVLGTGMDFTKKKAEQKAAELAYLKIFSQEK